MNGPSKELLPLKTKVGKVKRSLDDQKFENVCYGTPYSDDSENDTTCPETANIGYGCHSKAEKSASSNNELDADSDKGEEQLIIQPEELFGNLARKWQQRSQLDCDSNLQTEKKAFSENIKRSFLLPRTQNLKSRRRTANKENKPLKDTLTKSLFSRSQENLKTEKFLQPLDSCSYTFGESNPLQTCLNYTSPSAPDISETLSLFDSPYPPKRPKLEPAFFSSITDMEKEPSYTNGDSADCNISTLLNMGNTCFLNSVLYTLRFAPTFLHNLHHLLVDLSLINSKLKENKTKTSSLGRNGSAVSGSSWRSASSKDLLSIGSNDVIPKSKDQIVTEKLHALFVTMNNLETKGSPDPFQPEALLQAIRDANPMFEGNHQQDAHEFFVELLSCLRVTCDRLNEQIEQNPDLIKTSDTTTATVNNNNKIFGVRRSWKKPLKKKDKSSKKNGDLENDVGATDSEENLSHAGSGDSIKKKFGYNFIAEDFQGVSLHRTICLECEEVSELKEPFLEIQVPVNYRDEDYVESSIFGSICVTSEKLCDQNKYFCENCNRYNEAQRTVLYEKLPNIMVLHLKRFTTSLSGVQKVNTYVPTPLEIRCFCESCSKTEKSKTTPHKYQLSCVIMHLGASMASGHYIAYSRAAAETCDYTDCSRDIPKSYLGSSSKEMSANILKFFKAKALGNSLSENQNGVGSNSKKNDSQVCQSINCCGIRGKLNLMPGGRNDDWLEFDDEKVKLMSNKEFVDMLNRRHDSTNTPYLLFYSKK